jgi:hypothetical protein
MATAGLALNGKSRPQTGNTDSADTGYNVAETSGSTIIIIIRRFSPAVRTY